MSENDIEFLEEIQNDFLQEASDLVSSIESNFLELEKNPSARSELEKILRLFHNLKGSAAAVGFKHLSDFCHHIENLLVKIHDGELNATSQIIELLLKCTDEVAKSLESLKSDRHLIQDFSEFINEIEKTLQIKTTCNCLFEEKSVFLPDMVVLVKKMMALMNINKIFPSCNFLSSQLKVLHFLLQNDLGDKYIKKAIYIFDCIETSNSADQKAEYQLAMNLLKKYISNVENYLQEGQPKKEESNEDEENLALFANEIQEFDQSLTQDFIADADDQLELIDNHLISLERDPNNMEDIDSIFRGYHTLKGASAIIHFKEIESLAHKVETVLEGIRAKKSCEGTDVVGLCLQSTSIIKSLIESKLMGKRENLEESIANYKNFIQQISGDTKSNINPTNLEPDKSPEDTSATKEEREQADGNDVKKQEVLLREPIKVDADRVDRLVDLIGELVIAETMLSQAPELIQISTGTNLSKNLDRINKITRSLQEMGLAIRMVPIRHTFKKMTRIVRDVSKKLNKEIDYYVLGEETEIDRTIADKIGDPLVHMVRNAIDHGIEKTKEDRAKKGKSEVGRVSLRAFHKGGNIWIEIEDDGRGLDKNALIDKATEKGIIRSNAVLSDKEAYHLIFAPGFSTAEKITDVSGRGVGMDVVRKNIEELRGSIDIETIKGEGTIFRIRIPNTLAIIEGMVVVVGNERYVIPTQSILMAIKPEKNRLYFSSGTKQEMFDYHGKTLPLFRLSGEI